MNPVIDLLKKHRSIRKFSDKEIADEVLDQILEAGQWAATSNNLQAYSVIKIRNQDKKDELARLSGGQQHVRDCQVFLVFCADMSRIHLSSRMHEVPAHLDTVEPLLVAVVDTALMAQNVMVAAESCGIGGTYIGGIRNQIREVSDLLKLPDYVFPVFGMVLGYPDEQQIPAQKPRLPREAVVHEEAYQADRQPKAIESYDRVMKAYYEERTGGETSTTWSEYVSRIYREPRRVHLRGFLEEKKFGFK
ncbi:MAG: oxygen-insensitive NADPH nitroreductase [Bacillaceae bacterium]|nr:oxygen-insensitive NADPH nitroreductase [Bacillaceae bacterium]